MALDMTVHQPVVAGSFYPAGPAALEAAVDGLLTAAGGGLADQPKALILPHAGFRFSGAVAAAAAGCLRPGIERVVILGPSHHHAFPGIALPEADGLATPLGTVPLDGEVCARLRAAPEVATVPEAYDREHAIEVELPFLQRRLGAVTLVPMVVGEIAPERLAQILSAVWGGPETLIVVSTDLTHFLTAAEAAETDAATARQVELADPAGLDRHRACGYRPLAAFLELAAQKGLVIRRRALTHSGAVTGDETRTVGYGAWTAHEPGAATLSPGLRHAALTIAAQVLHRHARNGKTPTVHLPSFAPPLQGIGASFVTLTRAGRLCGCIGSVVPHRPLAEDIAANAAKAAFADPRFKPMTADALPGTEVEIALLSRPVPMLFRNRDDLLAQLVPGQDGLILSDGRHRGTFLPKVWEKLPDPDAFLPALMVKAGLARDHWSDSLTVTRYRTESLVATLAAPPAETPANHPEG